MKLSNLNEKNLLERASHVDAHVGKRLRQRRVMLGLSQQKIANLIGVTYQQAHKYEKGTNRISAGRLYQIAYVLSVPVSYFFDGLEEVTEQDESLNHRQRMCLEISRNFFSIKNEKYQEALSYFSRLFMEED